MSASEQTPFNILDTIEKNFMHPGSEPILYHDVAGDSVCYVIVLIYRT